MPWETNNLNNSLSLLRHLSLLNISLSHNITTTKPPPPVLCRKSTKPPSTSQKTTINITPHNPIHWPQVSSKTISNPTKAKTHFYRDYPLVPGPPRVPQHGRFWVRTLHSSLSDCDDLLSQRLPYFSLFHFMDWKFEFGSDLKPKVWYFG